MSSFASAIREMLNEENTSGGGTSSMKGAMIAKVVDNVDPEGRYRVRVSFPWLADSYTKDTTSDGSGAKVQSYWARMTAMMASSDTGSFWIPEIDDEVLVVFENGDFARPIITGSLWNANKAAPKQLKYSPDNTSVSVANGKQNGENNYRFIRSRMGHALAFIDKSGKGGVSLRSAKAAELYLDDTDGSERIRLYDGKQNQWLEIDTANKKITLQTDTGDILVKAKEKIRVECKNLEVNADQNISIEAGQTIKQKCTNYKAESSQSTDMNGGTKMKLAATRIDLNP